MYRNSRYLSTELCKAGNCAAVPSQASARKSYLKPSQNFNLLLKNLPPRPAAVLKVPQPRSFKARASINEFSAMLRKILLKCTTLEYCNTERVFSSVVSLNWLDSVEPTFMSTRIGLKAGATSNGLANHFVDTALATMGDQDQISREVE
jgi:hypothetical protein